jgi:hypothetical protein
MELEKLIIVFTRPCPHIPIPSQLNPVQALPTFIFKTHFHVIIPFMSGSLNCPNLSVSLTKILYEFLLVPLRTIEISPCILYGLFWASIFKGMKINKMAKIYYSPTYTLEGQTINILK